MRYLLSGLIILVACSTQDSNEDDSRDSVAISNPSNAGASLPNLTTNERGDPVMTWVEEQKGVSTLLYSTLKGDDWSQPSIISQGNDWFVNWADFPSLAVHPSGAMAAHYLAKNGEGTFAYGVNLVFSEDGGLWSDPIIPHETETETEHGFVSLFPYGEGFFATWLDGRNTGGGHGHGGGPMTLRAAFLTREGKVLEEFLLDDRICDCCQTSAVLVDGKPVVAYRDRSESEIRDMSIVRWDGTHWSDPSTIHDDGWVISGCPVNGPVLSSAGNSVAAAWFTSPEGQSMVNLSFSEDGGEDFSEPLQIDLGSPLGRIDMVMSAPGKVHVVWMEANGDDARIILGAYEAQGSIGEIKTLAITSSERSSGFPRMTLTGNQILVAWRDMTDAGGIAMSSIKI